MLLPLGDQGVPVRSLYSDGQTATSLNTHVPPRGRNTTCIIPLIKPKINVAIEHFKHNGQVALRTRKTILATFLAAMLTAQYLQCRLQHQQVFFFLFRSLHIFGKDTRIRTWTARFWRAAGYRFNISLWRRGRGSNPQGFLHSTVFKTVSVASYRIAPPWRKI